MEVTAPEDDQGAAVQTLRFLHGRGPVFYACLPQNIEVKHRLVSTLWNQFAATENPHWQRCQTSAIERLPLQLVQDRLGKPHLLLGEDPGPAVSFSESGGKVWAALCGDGAEIGIDVAQADEFEGDYPLHRVFLPAELDHASTLTGDDVPAAAALLWSIKEAAVKALGCAFHLLEPRQIIVTPAAEETVEVNGGHTFAVVLAEKARERFPLAACHALQVRSFPQRRMCLSIARWQRRATAS